MYEKLLGNQYRTNTEKNLLFVANVGFSRWSDCLLVASFCRFLAYNVLYSK